MDYCKLDGAINYLFCLHIQELIANFAKDFMQLLSG